MDTEAGAEGIGKAWTHLLAWLALYSLGRPHATWGTGKRERRREKRRDERGTPIRIRVNGTTINKRYGCEITK